MEVCIKVYDSRTFSLSDTLMVGEGSFYGFKSLVGGIKLEDVDRRFIELLAGKTEVEVPEAKLTISDIEMNVPSAITDASPIYFAHFWEMVRRDACGNSALPNFSRVPVYFRYSDKDGNPVVIAARKGTLDIDMGPLIFDCWSLRIIEGEEVPTIRFPGIVISA